MNEPADIIATRGEWTTLVQFSKRIGGFPGSIDSAEGFPSIAGLGDVLRLSDVLAQALEQTGATPVLVLVTFREGPVGYELDAPSWQVSVDGGEPCPIAEWFGVNMEGLDPAALQAVINLAPGGPYEGGGGAEPAWRVQRLP